MSLSDHEKGIFMDAIEAIFTRQSVSKMLPDPISRELIEKLLAAAAQAPNHYRVRPWRFIVISGEARSRLGEQMARSLVKRHPEASAAELDKERSRPLRAPVLIAVAVDHPEEKKVLEIENICAAAAAVQNILLAAHASGVGAMWRTGPAAYDPEIKTYLGIDPSQHLIGYVYIGYPVEPLNPPQRPDYTDRTVWLE